MKRKLSFDSEVTAELTGPNSTSESPSESSLGPEAVSEEDHGDRQWSKMMLHNLHFCASKANKRGSSLEDEWKILYPCSILTPRNLKSRFTVYERTTGTAPPKHPIYPGGIKKPKKGSTSSTNPTAKQPLEPVLISILPKPETSNTFSAVSATGGGVRNSISPVLKSPTPTGERYASQPQTKKSPGSGQGKENSLDSGLLDYGLTSTQQYFCKERPVEYPELPRSKWICDYHYMHVFYDDENKSYECILTDQLLQMRHSLVPHFPGQDLYKTGKKPSGFAPLLLHQWKQYYPDSEENTKTISMKLGKYDRSFQILTQKPVSKEGKVNWTPNMIEYIRLSRERALARLVPGKLQDLSELWKEEWGKIYPGMNASCWKQVLNRYKYHFGEAEQKDEIDKRSSDTVKVEGVEPTKKRPKLQSYEEEDGDEVKGLRQWNKSMQEDLLILKDLIFEEYPEIDPGSTEFAQKLLQAFQLRHPSCLETARSLLARIKDPVVSPNKYQQTKSETNKTPGKSVHNAALRKSVVAGIEGFTDWNLSMLKDFISCMDKTRKEYAIMKVSDPNLKLVPLLLDEWMKIYPRSQETVKSFLVRIRHLKLNKEKIKEYLNTNHDLVKQEEEEDILGLEEPMVTEGEISYDGFAKREEGDRFTWNSQIMMPDVIATRAKAVAIQTREAKLGRKVSYSKIWMKEFKKLFPNCPYTANNLSVHYFYWNNKESGKPNSSASTPSRAQSPVIYINKTIWTEDKLNHLVNIAKNIINTNKPPAKLKQQLKSCWQRSYPGSVESGEDLVTMYLKIKAERPEEIELPKQSIIKADEPWSPKLNKDLRQLVEELCVTKDYTTRQFVTKWRQLHPLRRDSFSYLMLKLEDNDLQPPLVEVIRKETTPSIKEEEEIKTEPEIKIENYETAPNYLNNRGQMRWSQEAITNLINCHKMATQSKNSLYNQKLADVLHAEFRKIYPRCPVGPTVLLTKCYIFRSEIKNGKLVLKEQPDLDNSKTGQASLCSLTGRSWTPEMLAEIAPSRQRAIQRKRQILLTQIKSPMLGDLWLDEFRKKFPNAKCSKKTLMKKYKQCQTRVDPPLDVIPTLTSDIFLELKGMLENKEVILPPEIPTTTFQVVEQWIFNSVQKMLAEQVKKEEDIAEVDETSQDTAEVKTEDTEESNQIDPAQESNQTETAQENQPNCNSNNFLNNMPLEELKSEPILEASQSSGDTYLPYVNKQHIQINHTEGSSDQPAEYLLDTPEASLPANLLPQQTSNNSLEADASSTLTLSPPRYALSVPGIINGLHPTETYASNDATAADVGMIEADAVKQEEDDLFIQQTVENTSEVPLNIQDVGMTGRASMDISSDAEAAQLLSEIANQVPFQFQELQMRTARMEPEGSTASQELFNTADNHFVQNDNPQMNNMQQWQQPYEQKPEHLSSDSLNNLNQTTVNTQQTDLTIKQPDTSANVTPPQPVETVLADGSNIITITTVEAPGEGGAVKKICIGNDGMDQEMNDWFPGMNYLMCPAPDAMKSHLQEKLCSLGLEADNLHPALNIYQRARSRFIVLLTNGYLASWSNLLEDTWNSESLPPVKYNDIEEMISMVLDDSGLRLENKTFDRITQPVQSWDSDRLNKVLKIGLDHRTDLKRGFNELEASGFNLSLKEFISILIISGIIKKKLSADSLDIDLEIIETWHSMKLKSDDNQSADNQPSDWSEPKRILHKISERSHDLSLGQVGYWLRKTKNITGKKKIPGLFRRVLLTRSIREDLADIKNRAFKRWSRLPRWKKYITSLASILREMTKKLPIKQSLVIGVISKLSVEAGRKISRQEKIQIDDINQDYLDNLNASCDDLDEYSEDSDSAEVELVDQDKVNELDFTKEENVLHFLRKKENRKRLMASGWSLDNITLLLKARSEALTLFLRNQNNLKSLSPSGASLSSTRSNYLPGSSNGTGSSPVKQRTLTEYLVERWCALKPGQININPWNLILTIRKVKELQQQLILEQENTIRLKDCQEYEPHEDEIISCGSRSLRNSRSSSSGQEIYFSMGYKPSRPGSRIPVLVNTPYQPDTPVNKHQELAHWPDHLILDADDHHYFVYDTEDDSDVDLVEGTEYETYLDLDDHQIQQLKEKTDEEPTKDKPVELVPEIYECGVCYAMFHNVNNYQLHRSLHVNLPIHRPPDQQEHRSLLKKLTWSPGYQDPKGAPYYDYSFYTCAEIVDDLVDALNI